MNFRFLLLLAIIKCLTRPKTSGTLATDNYRARQYHPGLGQFMSLDPIGGWGDPTNLGNPYAYVGNNPGSRTDPSGRCPWCLAGALIGSAVGALWQTGAYGYEVVSTGSSWDHQAAASRIKFGLIAGAAIGATGGAGASVTAAVGASGAGTAAIAGTTITVGAGEGIAGQAIMELLTEGKLSRDVGSYASSAVFGAATAGLGYSAGRLLAGSGKGVATGGSASGEGIGQRVGVIGEAQNARVLPFAHELESQGYSVVTFRPSRTDLSPDQLLAENRAWIQGLKADRCPIFDCGPAPWRTNYPNPTSRFYAMELEEMVGYPHYIRLWRR